MTGRTRAELRHRLRPFLLTPLIIAADQLSKVLVVRNIEPLRTAGERIEVLGTFLQFVFTQNLGVVFGLGNQIGPVVRTVLFIGAPILVLAAVVLYLLRSDEPTRFQRWVLAGIVGGGIGNLIDRIARADGVVDFILVRMYGLFGMEYFPVFNLADSALTVCAILMVGSVVFAGRGGARPGK